MYSPEVIQNLKNRIGFGNSSLPDEVDESNVDGTTGRTFAFYHRLVNLNNIYMTMDEIEASQTKFNAFLDQLKLDVIKSVLTGLLHKNKYYRSSKDYSDIIIDKAEIFDDCIGYNMAITCIEMLISSSRINQQQRNAELKYDKLKIELEGFKDSKGNQIAIGLTSKYSQAIKDASKILFPDGLRIQSPKVW